MPTQDINEDDTLKTPAGDLTIDSIDGEQVTLSNGATKHHDEVMDDIQFGGVGHVPAGTGERDTYIRFGDVPEREVSTNHGDGHTEAGVSVYETRETSEGALLPAGNKIQQVIFLTHRDAYLVSGERVGTGSDGEPVVRNVEIETELTSPDGVGGFVPAED